MASKETRVFVGQVKRNRRHQGVSLAELKRLEERRKSAFELRMAGATLQDIVNAGIGYNNTSMVSQDLKKARKNFYQEDIESLLTMDLARIDEMQKICTFELRAHRDTSQVRNIMALMQFRRETMGITPEAIQDRRTSAASITNNGIMVVQGSTRDYLAGVMSAAGATEDDIEQEFKELEPGNSGSHTGKSRVVPKVIQGEVIGEVIRPQTGEQAGEITSSATGLSRSVPSTKGKKKFKVVKKNSQQHDQPGSEATTATQTAREQPGGTGRPDSDSILFEDRLRAVQGQQDAKLERVMKQSLGKLSDPAVLPVELVQEFPVKEFPVKLPDANVPVSSGISYKIPPRKLTTEEAQKHVTRKLKRPVTSTSTDRVHTRVHIEEI